MKLNIVPARTGLTWVKLGIKTYLQQPLALSGLFFMFMALLSIATLLPFIGAALALALLPAATLGLMAATQEATKGKFPMPSILISAFRAGKQRMRAMLVLGALYAAGGKITEAVVIKGDFQAAMWVTLVLYLPLSLLFWHAPALVHWHGVTPVKSLFFSFIACQKNWAALTVYGLAWAGIFLGTMIVVTLVAALLGNPAIATLAIFPTALLLMAMFFTSVYFTFRDSFTDTSSEQAHALADTLPKNQP
jgi:hypothetical protein